MNPWLIFILTVIILHYILDIVVSYLNLKALSPQLPAEFSEIYDQKQYGQSQDYTRRNIRFSLLETTITTFLTIVFLLAGGFNAVDQLVRAFGFGPIITGLLFTGCLLLLSFLVNLPFSIYSTFKLEADFGFNRTTPTTFISDLAKALALTLLIGAPILALILWFFLSAGSYAWLYCWIGLVLISIIMQFLAPVLIMPLFNKFTPLEEGSLKDRIMSYAERERFRIKGIFTMDGSRRSAKLNAFFTGFGRFRRIVFFDTLVEKLSDGEIVAVLAHEMGHFKKKHIWKMIAASILQTGFMFYLLSYFIENESLFRAFGMEQVSVYASLIFFAFIYSPLSFLLAILFNYFSRLYEFEADRYAAETTGKPRLMIEGLKKLSRENLANLTPHPLQVFLSYSHPPVLERIRALEQVEEVG